MELKDVLKYLSDNGYVLHNKKTGYALSNTFQQAVLRMQKGQPAQMIIPLLDENLHSITKIESVNVQVVPVAITNWELAFLNFIAEAKVPARLEGSKGAEYAANKYNEKAMKVFRKALEKDGIDYKMLIMSTLLYYKSSNRFKKTVGNYFIDGDWKTDYIALRSKAEAGEKELKDHIKTETKDAGHSPYRF